MKALSRADLRLALWLVKEGATFLLCLGAALAVMVFLSALIGPQHCTLYGCGGAT